MKTINRRFSTTVISAFRLSMLGLLLAFLCSMGAKAAYADGQMGVTISINQDLGTTAAGAAATVALTANKQLPAQAIFNSPFTSTTCHWTVTETRFQATPDADWETLTEGVSITSTALTPTEAKLQTAFTAEGKYQLDLKAD